MKNYLIIKVFFIHLLIRFGIIENVWYNSEIELGKIRGKELSEFLKRDK